jgi:cyclase
MLTKRIIPCLDVDNGRVVKGVSFLNLRDAGDPVSLASFYDSEGADELVFLDITASSENRETMANVVKDVAAQVFIPLTVGGGIRNTSDIRKMLESGADKVSLNTAAILNPDFVKEAALFFGSQCIVVAIDARRISINTKENVKFDGAYHSDISIQDDSKWEVVTHGGRRATGIDVIKWAKKVNDLGCGEILLTSMDSDGHESGYDLDLLTTVSTAVSVPVIASGGAGILDHFADAINIGKVDAVLAASIFHFDIFTIAEVKEHLKSKGIPVRI